MATTNISIRMDSDLKAQADALFGELGMNLSTAFNIFVRQSLRDGGIPFEISLNQPNKETIAAMLEAERIAKDPSVKGYTNTDGVLLEENSMNELQKKNSKYILLQVSDIPKTSLVLERQFGVTEYSVQDEHTLRIYDTSLDMAAVNKALVVQDIAVISSQLCNDTLEDYFKKITGGEGIA